MFSLSCLGLASANNLALTKITLISAPAIGIVVGVQHVAAGLSGGFAAGLSGWLLDRSGSYDLPMLVIVVFLSIGALAAGLLEARMVAQDGWLEHFQRHFGAVLVERHRTGERSARYSQRPNQFTAAPDRQTATAQ